MKTMKQFNEEKKNATLQVNAYTGNIFHSCNELNKAARKNEFCDAKAVKPIADAIHQIHGGRYPFNLDIFLKDDLGRFCETQPVKDADGVPACFKTFCGLDIIETAAGRVFLVPIKTDIKGLFGAFCRVAKSEIKDTINAAKEAERETKKAAKVAKKAEKAAAKVAKARAAIRAAFGEIEATLSDDECLKKFAIIKGQKAA